MGHDGCAKAVWGIEDLEKLSVNQLQDLQEPAQTGTNHKFHPRSLLLVTQIYNCRHTIWGSDSGPPNLGS